MPDISVVIPIHNEEDNLHELCRRLVNVLVDELNMTYELIFIDDGSTDNSWNIIHTLHNNDSNVKGIRFSRNFGHHVAISAGIDHASGAQVVLMDGDLQDPPEEIVKLYSKFKEGYDIVVARRQIRNDPIFKKMTSKMFHVLFKLLCNVEISSDCGTFRIMSRRSVLRLRSCREKVRFLNGLISWTGFSIVKVDTRRDTRYAGSTKIGLVKSVKLATDAITSFSYFPLRIAMYIGFVISFVSFLIGVYFIIRKLFIGIPILGYASIIVLILFIVGVQLIILGMIGEYIGRIYTEVRDRPMYVVLNKLGTMHSNDVITIDKDL